MTSVCGATLWPFPQITSNSHIGCFEYMKEKFAHSPTRDMSEEMLVLFSNLMRVKKNCVPRGICVHLFLVFHHFSSHPTLPLPLLQAQAQELLWEKQQLLGLKDDIMAVIDYAHRTKSVSETLYSCVVLIDPSPLINWVVSSRATGLTPDRLGSVQ